MPQSATAMARTSVAIWKDEVKQADLSQGDCKRLLELAGRLMDAMVDRIALMEQERNSSPVEPVGG